MDKHRDNSGLLLCTSIYAQYCALTQKSRSQDHRLPCDVNVEQKVDGMIKSERSCFHFFFSLKKKAEVCLVWVTCHFPGLSMMSLLNRLISPPTLECHIHSNEIWTVTDLWKKWSTYILLCNSSGIFNINKQILHSCYRPTANSL